VQAVDSENSKNLTADVRRRLQILKALADPNHYYSTFTTGNEKTLPVESDVDGVRDALLAFHRYHYRPENLVVVIVGPQTLDTLQDWLVPRFSSMKAPIIEEETEADKLIAEAAKAMPNFAHDQPPPPYRPAFRKELQGGTWPVLLTVKPIKPIRKLTLNFPMPSTRYFGDQDPVQVLGHLLGHEGVGSPFASLQNEGLITSLSSGPRVSGPDQTLFQLDVALTKQGEEQWEKVVDLILAHCRLIHETAVEAEKNPGGNADQDLRRMWGELATLGAMHFEQTSPGAAYDFAPALVQRIVKEGTEKSLSAGRMLDETPETFPLERFVDFSSRLVADNCIVERCSQAAWDEAEKMSNEKKEDKPGFGKQTEQWYGIDYYLSSIDPDVVRGWEGKPTNAFEAIDHSTLHLPGPNLFIPRTLELCDELPPEAKLGPRIEKEIDPPNLLVDEAGGRLWHRLDDRYALPKATMTFLLRNAAVENVLAYGTWQHDVDATIHSSILSGLFSQALKQETYDADLAGLSWSLSTSSSGIALHCAGYSDRLPDLALKVLKDFLMPEESEVGVDAIFKETYFRSVKDAIVRSLSNYFEAHRADVHAQYYRDLLMSSESNGIDTSLAAVEVATLDSVKEHHRRLLQNKEMEIECLYSGNVPESQAKDFYDRASHIVREATEKSREEINGASATSAVDPWVPGKFFDVRLHLISALGFSRHLR
jgi:insulysin